MKVTAWRHLVGHDAVLLVAGEGDGVQLLAAVAALLQQPPQLLQAVNPLAVAAPAHTNLHLHLNLHLNLLLLHLHLNLNLNLALT